MAGGCKKCALTHRRRLVEMVRSGKSAEALAPGHIRRFREEVSGPCASGGQPTCAAGLPPPRAAEYAPDEPDTSTSAPRSRLAATAAGSSGTGTPGRQHWPGDSRLKKRSGGGLQPDMALPTAR